MNRRYDHSTGFTLLELLVGMTIGIVISASIVQVYLANKVSYRTAEGVARLQENSRFVVNFLRQGIQLAGYPGVNDITPLNTANSADGSGSGSTGDSIAVQFFDTADCLGQTPADAQIRVENHYFLDQRAGAATTGLYCDSSLSAADELIVEGIDHMQILYGIDNADTDKVANRYINFTALNTASALNPSIWENIVSIRIALVMNTVVPIRTATLSQTFRLLDGPTLTYTDRLGRRMVTTTIPLRNRMF